MKKRPNTRERYLEISAMASEVGTWMLQMQAITGDKPEWTERLIESLAKLVAGIEVVAQRLPPAKESN